MQQISQGPDLPDPDVLDRGSVLLNGQYVIQSPLRAGGFGMTYLARDSLDRQVVIKECFPDGFCTRVRGNIVPISKEMDTQFGLIKKQFVREARQTAKLTHPNIIAVHQVFEENNTVYMALDEVKGVDLVTLAETQPHRLSNKLLGTLLNQSLRVLDFIHRNGLLHRDISPDNLMLDDRNHLTLIDFGAVAERKDTTLWSHYAVKDGYSPYEFYSPKSDHSPASDIYALGATFYYMITGQAPVSSDVRFNEKKSSGVDPYVPLLGSTRTFNSEFLQTVDRALAMRPQDRFQTARDWHAGLVKARQEAPAPQTASSPSNVLEDEIARLVQTTNSDLVARGPGTERTVESEPSKPEAVAPEKSEERKLFDIFGAPIDDIAAWQEMQEQEIREREAAHEESASGTTRRGLLSGASTSSEGTKTAGGRLSGVLGRIWNKQTKQENETADI